MKSAAFEYRRAASIEEAMTLLGEEGVFAKPLAGSQSLGPMLNLRIAQPDRLVDITSISELNSVSDNRDFVDIGACVTHADVEDGRIVDASMGLLAFVARKIAYRAVRNRGTIGGSLAHSDPAADWVSALPLLGAKALVVSPKGERVLPVKSLMVSSFVTALERDEIIRAVRVPKASPSARWGFTKFNRKAGEFAHAIAGVFHDPETADFRVVIGAIETAPIVVEDASFLFGGRFDSDMHERLDDNAVLMLLKEKNVDDVYVQQLAITALRRAAKQAGMK
ncbi:carbon monoxide dehydrogenase [Mesorhizobium sp. M7A.F.Ca.US.006.01.1.1]|uniref:FAD binding domain-containing protein n=1 Tax=Mesorhizobium sp. M7A.F.Ca.US.006.01.1.1 TaxID=2496707 RepID=UPI000FCA1523|nr:FAD binding domain-containing protein [Mesorhizobium sp. M7A.F.Ca.US.006.01.1.1]RUZ73358.1 carbon monoxide dehydrogenase [Mesorhizobium sp. M7A.F.Ca.US.006.01.1.1]